MKKYVYVVKTTCRGGFGEHYPAAYVDCFKNEKLARKKYELGKKHLKEVFYEREIDKVRDIVDTDWQFIIYYKDDNYFMCEIEKLEIKKR